MKLKHIGQAPKLFEDYFYVHLVLRWSQGNTEISHGHRETLNIRDWIIK